MSQLNGLPTLTIVEHFLLWLSPERFLGNINEVRGFKGKDDQCYPLVYLPVDALIPF